MTGDSHYHGLRIVLNTMFTLQVYQSQFFVIVHGLLLGWMLSNEMVTVPICGLIAGSDRDI